MQSDWEAWVAEQEDIAFMTIEATDDYISFKIDDNDEEYRLTKAGTDEENEFWVLSVGEGIESELVDAANSEFCMMDNSQPSTDFFDVIVSEH